MRRRSSAAPCTARKPDPQRVYRFQQDDGHPIHPHQFRDIAATTLALDRPDQALLARDLLGHSDFRMTEKHDLHTQTAVAGRSNANTIESLRRARKSARPAGHRMVQPHSLPRDLTSSARPVTSDLAHKKKRWINPEFGTSWQLQESLWSAKKRLTAAVHRGEIVVFAGSA
jgi:hypothetical protein